MTHFDLPPFKATATLEEVLTTKLQFSVNVLEHLFNGPTPGAARAWGFTLVVFPFNSPGKAAFGSNGVSPDEAVTVWRELITSIGARRMERMDEPGDEPGDTPAQAAPPVPGEKLIGNLRTPKGPGSTLAGRWEIARQRLLPPDLDRRAVEAFRQAFYVGATEFLLLMDERLTDPGDEVTPDEAAWMEALRDELSTFVLDL